MTRATFFLLALLLTTSTGALAHPAHDSLAEVELADDKQHLEVSWELEKSDLELFLAIHSRKHVALDDGDKWNPLLLQFIADTFVVDDGQKANAKRIQLVGVERGPRRVVLYFTLAVATSNTATLHVPALLDFDAQQVNRIVGEVCGQKLSLRFDAEHSKPKPLPLGCVTSKK